MSSHSPEAPSRTLTVYDMDGVLFDTVQAVLDSYREAGVETYGDMPIGLSWEQWLVPLYGRERAEELHTEKNRIYRRKILANEVGTLPPLKLLRSNVRSSRVCTSASRDAANTLLSFHIGSDHHSLPVHTGATPEMKVEELVGVGRMAWPQHFVYVDDRRDLGQRIVDAANRLGTGTWRLVHYRGQSYEDFAREVYA